MESVEGRRTGQEEKLTKRQCLPERPLQRGLMEEVILKPWESWGFPGRVGWRYIKVGELWTMTNRLGNPSFGVGTRGRFGTWSRWKRSGWERKDILAVWGGFTEGVLE